jgi:hypothetical protein
MKKASLLVVPLLLTGCTQSPFEEKMAVPKFSVAVNFSQAAKNRLMSLNEGVTVSAVFDGDGEPLKGAKTAPNRDVFLGHAKSEVDANGVAFFSGIEIPTSAYKRLSDKNYYVTLNIFSSRKATKDNFLDCGVQDERIEVAKREAIKSDCKLIGEK